MSGPRAVMPIATSGKMASQVMIARVCIEGMCMEGMCTDGAGAETDTETVAGAALSAGAVSGISVLMTFSN
ncbi:hypothetical protein GCM10023063_47670 [Arthrobacter methylotrophus]